jgi:hypothetical protein
MTIGSIVTVHVTLADSYGNLIAAGALAGQPTNTKLAVIGEQEGYIDCGAA